MKKFYIAASVVLATAAMTACSGSDNASKAAPEAAANGADASKSAITANFRYIDLDSILANYTLAQEFSQESQKMMLEYQNLERQKGSELQNLGNSIQQKVNNSGYLTQESYQADVNSFNKKQTDAQNALAARQNQINQRVAEQQQRLNDSIQSFIRDYNATHHYDAILYHEAGVYFNPALNITEEVISGLNARYTPAKAEDKK